METKFNSQICTSKVQSERLLALGLKKETADMRRPHYNEHTPWVIDERDCLNEHWLPAWSLHRLIEMMPQTIEYLELAVNDEFVGYHENRCESEMGLYWEHSEESRNLYDNIISTIEWLIKEGYFNKKYLV